MKHKRSIPNRSYRVADQIQRDVAELIRDLKDPRVGMVTVNSVESLLQLSASFYVSRALHAVAELGVADALGDTPQPTASLAETTAVDAGALRRPSVRVQVQLVIHRVQDASLYRFQAVADVG